MFKRIIIPFLKHVKYETWNRSYSQLGEDLVIKNQLGRISKDYPKTYLDIGAYHFSIGSNTYSLYKDGWEGTVVDCNATKLSAFRYFRPRDKTISAAIVPNSYHKNSIEISSTGMFDARESVIKNLNKHSTMIEDGTIKTVPAIKIGDLIASACNGKKLPTVLSIDIEGLDSDVVKDIDFSEYPIPIICIEQFLSGFTSSQSILSYSESDLTQYMIASGYSLTSVCGPSCIYIRNDSIQK